MLFQFGSGFNYVLPNHYYKLLWHSCYMTVLKAAPNPAGRDQRFVCREHIRQHPSITARLPCST